MASRDLRSRLAKRAAKAGVFLPDALSEGLLAYFDLLARWNRKINLTALDDSDEAVDRLLIEPVIAVRFVPAGATRLIDIGSGGGSPSIPMRMALPGLRLTMVESKARKSAFLREAVRVLALADTVVETARYEELLARPELHEAFSALSVRAVRMESRVLQNLQAFLPPGGVMLLFRGPGGPEAPGAVFPPLVWTATHPLVDSLRSRLTVLTKRAVGVAFHVPRGTVTS
ncbi:MAG TPA: 16S rRNA (guanine(527)-N(7))-methyltransferase RsmG [Vicinamibacterales bacterium]|nr:16S rRNA (guanine(527)-N(7))-methyltransferase RsmG [Vicinamibacterales bacterium]